MSEAAGTATHGGEDATPGQGQEALPVEEREQSVTQTVGSESETVHEETLVLTGTAQDGAAAASQKESGAADDAAPAAAAPRARTGSRAARTRAPKQDAVLTEAVALAREAVVDSPEGEAAVGQHLGVVVHEDRLLTHLFDCRLRGYPGWTWYATVARAPRTKHVTVCESGLVAGPDSLLAPDWVPWEERMQAMNDEEESPQEYAEGSDSADEQTGAEPESAEPTGTQSTDAETDDTETTGTAPTDAQSTDTARRDSHGDGEPSEDGASS